jgi:hypothetical protein
MKEVNDDHPAAGAISSSVCSGNRGYCVGSGAKHQHWVRIRISKARIGRSLCEDYVHEGPSIVEFRMTKDQFAHFVSRAGGAVPITLERIGKEGVPQYVPTVSDKEKFDEDLKNASEDAQARILKVMNMVMELSDNGKITKGISQSLSSELSMLKGFFDSSIPFIEEVFQEQVEKNIHKAKMEFDAYMETVLNNNRLRLEEPETPSREIIEVYPEIE